MPKRPKQRRPNVDPTFGQRFLAHLEVVWAERYLPAIRAAAVQPFDSIAYIESLCRVGLEFGERIWGGAIDATYARRFLACLELVEAARARGDVEAERLASYDLGSMYADLAARREHAEEVESARRASKESAKQAPEKREAWTETIIETLDEWTDVEPPERPPSFETVDKLWDAVAAKLGKSRTWVYRHATGKRVRPNLVAKVRKYIPRLVKRIET